MALAHARLLLQEPGLQERLAHRVGQRPVVAGETARQVVERGGSVCILPEGTRHRRGTIGNPKRGVGRRAL